jgi:hypothetical protein
VESSYHVRISNAVNLLLGAVSLAIAARFR